LTETIETQYLLPNTGQIDGLPKNPRFIRDDRFKKLVKSIQDDPEMLELRELIVYPVGKKYVVIAGNMRLRAGIEIGLTEMPCKVLAADTPVEKLRAYAVKDNVPFGENDWDTLANEWDEDELVGWGMELPTVFNAGEAQEDDYEIPDEIKTDIVLGDLFEIGPHRLLCGDSTDADQLSKLMNGEKADMVFTDPPYGISKEGIENDNLKGEEFYQFSSDYISIAPIKDNCGIVCYHSTRTFYHTLNAFVDNGWKFEKMLFFYRPDKFPVHTWNGWMMTSQAIMLFSKGSPVYLDVSPAHQDVYKITSADLTEGKVNHPTVKPVVHCSAVMGHYKAELIYDCFLGSGSTMVASHQLNRKCYGMELDPKYCQVIVDRMRKLEPTIEIKRNGVKI
jgi:DNA modification methylase